MDSELYSHDSSSSEDVGDSENPRRSRGKGASRISSACIECRRKKQKCSGEKPICSECRATGKVCDWPQPMRRGPSKNYIADLETRLTETECLLMSVLPYINAGQLHSAVLRQRSMLQGIPSSRPQAEGKLSQKKFGSAYWARYPMTDPEGVKQWWHDRKSRAAASNLPFSGGASILKTSQVQYLISVPDLSLVPATASYQPQALGSSAQFDPYAITSASEGQHYTHRAQNFPAQQSYLDYDQSGRIQGPQTHYGLGMAGDQQSPFSQPGQYRW